jgi:hypothetical protein
MAARRKTEAKDKAPEATEGLDREGLAAALGKLRPALRVGGAIPELAHMWFDVGRASAYDGGLGIRLTFDLGVACGAPGKALLGLLGTSALKQVTLALEGPALVVKMGRSRTKLNVLEPDRDPWPFPEKHGKAAHLSEAAVEALRSVLIAKATPPTRLEHHGVAVYASGADIDFYATDSKTLVQVAVTDDKAKLPKFTFIPRPLAEQIVALCPHGAEFYVADDHMAAVGRGVELCSNVLDVEGLRDIPALVARHHKKHPDPAPLPTGLEAALDRAEVLAGTGSDAAVTIAVRGKKFGMTGKFAFGELKEELVLEEAHPDTDITVEAAIMRRGLLVADSFSATEGSLAFYGGDNFLYLVAARR